jgi:hypothetical protein
VLGVDRAGVGAAVVGAAIDAGVGVCRRAVASSIIASIALPGTMKWLRILTAGRASALIARYSVARLTWSSAATSGTE